MTKARAQMVNMTALMRVTLGVWPNADRNDASTEFSCFSSVLCALRLIKNTKNETQLINGLTPVIIEETVDA